MAKEIQPRNARQGGNGPRMLFVLIGALVIACIAWAVIDFYFFQFAPQGTTPAPQSQLDNPGAATPQQSKPAPAPKASVPNPPDASPKQPQ